MSTIDFEEFIRQIQKEDSTAEIDLSAFLEKVATHIRIMEEAGLCLN